MTPFDDLARCEILAAKQGCVVSNITKRCIFDSDMKVCTLVSTGRAKRT